MKQSTKLLSLVLALVMAFGCFSVVASAEAVTRDSATYDSVDDAILTPTQVATIVVDLVDDMLLGANIKTMDLSILGQLRMDSVDHIIADVSSLRGSAAWTFGYLQLQVTVKATAHLFSVHTATYRFFTMYLTLYAVKMTQQTLT